MRAILCKKYGSPAEMQVAEVEKPVPGAEEVLVRIHFSAVNDYDWAIVRGKPRLYRLMFGLFKPKWPTPGMEFSGTIEGLGEGVTSFKVGDAVFGDTSEACFGTYAEYIAVSVKALTLKPAAMSFEQAAAITHAATLAWQGLFDTGKLQPGQSVLINGAGGGVGTLGLQFAKHHDATVTGVDSAGKLTMMRSLGFDQVYDYRETDFTRLADQYDLILDCKTSRSPWRLSRVLKKGGCYATVGGALPRLIQCMLLAPLVKLFTGKKIKIVALKTNKDLGPILTLWQGKGFKIIIDEKRFKLAQGAEALAYFGSAHHQGKVLIDCGRA